MGGLCLQHLLGCPACAKTAAATPALAGHSKDYTVKVSESEGEEEEEEGTGSAPGPYSSSKARLLFGVLGRTGNLQTALGLFHGWFFPERAPKICSPASMHLHS